MRKPRKQCLGIMVASVTVQATSVPFNQLRTKEETKIHRQTITPGFKADGSLKQLQFYFDTTLCYFILGELWKYKNHFKKHLLPLLCGSLFLLGSSFFVGASLAVERHNTEDGQTQRAGQCRDCASGKQVSEWNDLWGLKGIWPQEAERLPKTRTWQPGWFWVICLAVAAIGPTRSGSKQEGFLVDSLFSSPFGSSPINLPAMPHTLPLPLALHRAPCHTPQPSPLHSGPGLRLANAYSSSIFTRGLQRAGKRFWARQTARFL